MKLLGGKPLVEWTIEAAKDSRLVSDVVVSTEWDQVHDLAVSHKVGVHVRRVAEGREAAGVVCQVLRDVLHIVEYDSVVMLLPTSPFRTARHIDEAVELHERWAWHPNVLAVTHDPLATHKTFNRRGPHNLTKSGISRPVRENGAVLVARTDKLLADGFFDGEGAVAYVMDRESSLDLDWPDQWPQAESVASRRMAEAAA